MKKPRRPRPDPEDPDLLASPAFHKRPKRVVSDSPPDIPRNAVPVLRKPPVVIAHDTEPWRGRPAVRRLVPHALKDVVIPAKSAKKSLPTPRSPPKATRAQAKPTQGPRAPRVTSRHERTEAPPLPLEPPMRRPAWKPRRTTRRKIDEVPPPPDPIAPVAASAPTIVEVPPRPRPPGLTLTGLFGVGTFLLAVLLLVLNHNLPWITVNPDHAVGDFPTHRLGDGVLGRSDLDSERSANPYFDRIVFWPDICFLLAALLALALAILDALPAITPVNHRRAQLAMLGAEAFLGYVLLLSGVRWIGLFISAVLDSGPSPLHLHVVPYINFLAGAALLAAALALFRLRRAPSAPIEAHDRISDRDRRVATFVAVAAAVALLILPLVPMTSIRTENGTDYLNEGELSVAQRERDDALARTAQEYAWSRGLLWYVFYISWASLFVAELERTRPRPVLEGLFVLGFGLAGVLLALGALFAVLFQIQLWSLPEARPSLNLLLPLAYAAALAAYLAFVQRTLVPYVRHAKERYAA